MTSFRFPENVLALGLGLDLAEIRLTGKCRRSTFKEQYREIK